MKKREYTIDYEVIIMIFNFNIQWKEK
ncbi:uncharacterized protein METZ01_LOCUS39279 [marine metagenome]|uniref:Uncharacterized protein n=1 Tax=marine metagenome TaxID=408172 RepID=A0A381R3V2_9ZZZZ